MQKRIKAKWAAGGCAAVVIGFLLLYFGAVLYGIAVEREWAVLAIFGVYGAVILAVIVGLIVALRQRWKEIDNGEEEIAKQY